MEKELQNISALLEHGMEKLREGREQYRKQENELYWIQIRMQNNRERYSKEDLETMEHLGAFLETMTLFLEKILDLEETIKQDLAQLTQLNTVEEQSQVTALIKGKFDILYLLCEKYREKQSDYAVILKKAEERLQSRPSLWQQIRQKLMG